MSVESIAIALHHSRARNATALAVLVGIANHDGDGGAWPTVATLAHYARVQPRQVQKSLNELIALGEIHRDVQAGGTANMHHADRPNLYHFMLKCPAHCDGSRHHRLICQGCHKALPKTSQLDHYHEGCAPAYHDHAPAGEGVSYRTPGVLGDTRGVSCGTPKPSLEPTINYPGEESHIPAYVGNRAGARELTAGCTCGAQWASGDEPTCSCVDDGAAPAQAPEIDASGGSHRPAGASTAADPGPSFVRVYDDADDDVEACPRWRGSMPHTVGPHGRCIDCGAPVPGLVNTTTGEVHQ